MSNSLRRALAGAGLLGLLVSLGWFWLGRTPGGEGARPAGVDESLQPPGSTRGERIVTEELALEDRDTSSDAPTSTGPVTEAPEPPRGNSAANAPDAPVDAPTQRVRLEPRLIDAPKLDLRFVDPEGRGISTGGVAVLSLPLDVARGELSADAPRRRVRLDTLDLDRDGQVALEGLPSMAAIARMQVTLFAPGFDCDRPSEQLGKLDLGWSYEARELPLSPTPLLPIRVLVRDPSGYPVTDLPIFAVRHDEEVVQSVADQVYRHRAAAALRTGRERLWSSGATDYEGRVELQRISHDPLWLYSADPAWRIEPLRVAPGQIDVVARAVPVGYARFELGDGPFDPLGDVEEAGPLLTWKVEVAPQTLLQGVDAISSAPDGHLLRGRGTLDYSFDAMRSWWPEMHAGVLGMIRSGHPWSVLYSGPVQSFDARGRWKIDLRNLVGFDGIWRENEPLEDGVDLADERVPLRVVYPDGSPADAELRLRFGGEEHDFVAFDGDAKVELTRGAGYFSVMPAGGGGSLATELWAADFRGWLRAGLNPGESGDTPHIVVDYGARLRVEPPVSHVDTFSATLLVNMGAAFAIVDSTPLSTEAIDWRRLPYGDWRIERRDAGGALIDRSEVVLLRGRAARLDGEGQLVDWDGRLDG